MSAREGTVIKPEHHLLLLGSNHDAANALAAGLFALRSALTIRRRSSVYRTKAVGLSVASHYLNLAVAVECDDLDALKKLCKDIEQAAGRTPDASALGSISLDIDLVMSMDLADVRQPLMVHKPKMLALDYCFAPCAEIALEYLLQLEGIPAPSRRLEILSETERFALSRLL